MLIGKQRSASQQDCFFRAIEVFPCSFSPLSYVCSSLDMI